METTKAQRIGIEVISDSGTLATTQKLIIDKLVNAGLKLVIVY